MLFAFCNGKRVKASHSLDPQLAFTCCNPLCDHPALILKQGMIRQPYFSHKHKGLCDTSSEPESDAHIAMKEFMQAFLHVADNYVEYTQITGVRPDLFWKNKYAIEVQNSPIELAEFQRRNAIYSSNGVIPVWIFHESNFGEARDDSDESLSTLKAGIYGKIHGNESSTFRLKVVEQCIAQTCYAVFYLDFRTPLFLREFCTAFQARDCTPDFEETPPFHLRYYHTFFENMFEYVQHKPPRKKSLFIGLRDLEISDEPSFLNAIDNTQFNRVMTPFSRSRVNVNAKLLFLQLMHFLGISPSEDITFPQYPIWNDHFVILCKHWAELEDFWMPELEKISAQKLTPIVIFYLEDQVEQFRSVDFGLAQCYGGLLYFCAGPLHENDPKLNLEILWYSGYHVEEITTPARFGEIAEYCRRNWDDHHHIKNH